MTGNLQSQIEPAPGTAAAPWLIGRSPRRSAVRTILRKEIPQVAGSFRFKASAFLLVAVMALAAVTGGARYRSEVLGQSAVMDGYSREVSGAAIDQAAEILHPAVKPPWRLALVVDGGQTATPNVYAQALSALVAPEIRQIHSSNYRLPGREPLDWMFAIRVVLPLAAFLLGYDAVCGERREGTLKLLLSYPVARWKVLASKLLAIWICLAAPLLAGAAVSLLLALGPAGIPLEPGDLAKAGLVLLLGLWAAAFFVLIALLVSSLSRNPSASASVLVWLWVTGVIAVPALTDVLAHLLRPIPAEGEVRLQMEAIDRRIAREHGGREGHWRQPEWAAADGFAWERTSAAAENRRFVLQEEVRRGLLRRKIGQARLAGRLASLSPVAMTEDAAELLAGSGLGRDQSFLDQAWSFRPVLANRFQALDARDPRSPHILFFSGYLSKRPVEAGALPRFAFRERTVRQGLAAARPTLAVFALETAALAAASLFVFSRYDVG